MLGLLDYKTISQYPVRVATMLSVQYTLEITLHWILAPFAINYAISDNPVPL